MDCLTFRRLIPPFIAGELDDETLNEFLRHLNGCESCRDELEIHFIVTKGVEILDRRSSDCNLSAAFRQFVEKSRSYLDSRKRMLSLTYVVDTLLQWALVLCVFLFFRIYLLPMLL